LSFSVRSSVFSPVSSVEELDQYQGQLSMLNTSTTAESWTRISVWHLRNTIRHPALCSYGSLVRLLVPGTGLKEQLRRTGKQKKKEKKTCFLDHYVGFFPTCSLNVFSYLSYRICDLWH